MLVFSSQSFLQLCRRYDPSSDHRGWGRDRGVDSQMVWESVDVLSVGGPNSQIIPTFGAESAQRMPT